MTEPDPTPEPDADPTEQQPDALPKDIEAARKLRSEAANLRRENRELREANERLTNQTDARNRRDVEQAAASVLVDPTDVWRVDPDTQQSFYDEQFGEISGDHVIEAAKKLASEKPHLARPNTTPPPSQRPIEGLKSGARSDEKPTQATWASVLRR